MERVKQSVAARGLGCGGEGGRAKIGGAQRIFRQ